VNDPRLVDAQRQLGLRGGLHRYARMAWPTVEPNREFVDNWHIGAVCAHLEAVYRGQIKRLVINVPPGCMKSLTVSVLFPTWVWIQDPGYRMIYASYDSGLVGKRDGGKVLDIVRSPWYRQRWGDRVMVSDDAAAGDFQTTARGSRFATSIGGAMIGRHANFIGIDDPNKAQDLTEVALDNVADWRKGTQASRLLPGGAVVLMMQRLHENDLAGHALREGGWEHLCLPMRFESSRRCTTSIGFVDPRKEDGELLWPTYKSDEEVSQQERDMGSQVTSAQLQQRPAPAGGVVFMRPWFRYYKIAPERYDALCMSFDLAFKGAQTSDFVAAGVYGRKGADFYLLYLHVEKLDFPATLALIKSLARKWPKVSTKLVEDKANGPAVIDMLRKDVPGLIPVTPEGGKEARANAVSPLYEAGNVWYPDPSGAVIRPEEGHVETKTPIVWAGRPASIDLHVDSMAGFPFGTHDDDVDCETQALLHLRSRASRWLEAMQTLQKGSNRVA
jgi:predicted phage terminase large subunit-like protein